MDLRQIGRAVAAHKAVATLGVIAAIGFAVLAYVRVDPLGDPKLQYRKPILWGSKLTLQLTQEGFPEGQVRDLGARRDALVGLAPLYARLANTDPVKARMRRLGPIHGGVRIDPVVDENESSLPLVKITSFAFSQSAAMTRARRQASAFMGYLAQQQTAHNVPVRNRVLLSVLSGPSAPEVVVPRKKTLPITVFLAMLVVTAGVILTLENLRKRDRRQEAVPDVGPLPEIVPPAEALREVPAPPDRVPVARPEAARPDARTGQLATPPRTLRGESFEKGRPRQPLGTSTEDDDDSQLPDTPAQQAGASSRRRR